MSGELPSQGAGPRHLASDGDGPQAPAHGPARKCSDGFGPLLEERRLLVDLLLMAGLMDTPALPLTVESTIGMAHDGSGHDRPFCGIVSCAARPRTFIGCVRDRPVAPWESLL